MPVLFLQGISHPEGVQLSMLVEWGLKSPQKGRCASVCVRECGSGGGGGGGCRKINCVCDLNESLNSGEEGGRGGGCCGEG